MTERKKRNGLFLLLSAGTLAFALAGACFARAEGVTASADEAAPEPGRLELEQTDALGNRVVVPVEFDGETYALKDLVRNIFVCNAASARSYQDLTRTDFPVYTSETGVFDDGMAISIYANTIKAYDFYSAQMVGRDFYGVNGLNDGEKNLSQRKEEIPLYIDVHFNAAGMRFNAAYTPLEELHAALMVVGDGGDSNSQSDLYMQGTACDIISHEYQHGITQHTANLNTGGDPGAINEAISDIFGALIEGHDPSEEDFWLMGEDCSARGVAMRSVKDPKNCGTKGAETLDDKAVCQHRRHNNSCDDGWVHYNSTIISHLQYTAYEQYPEFFTRERIARLWFETLCRIKPDVTFRDFAVEFRAAAVSLQFEEKAMDAIDYSLYVNGFPSTGKFHKVSFMNEDGSLLTSEVVKHGESAVAPENPVKAATEEYRYIFDGWDSAFDKVTSDLVVKPIFRTELRYYSVEFLDAAGQIFKQQDNVSYADLDTVKSTEDLTPPEKESTAQFYYEFDHWDVSVDEDNGKVTITPLYREKTQVYTVIYQYRGEEYYSVTRPYGTLELVELPEGCLGWYMDKDCTVAASGRMLDRNMTIYGKPEHDFTPIIITVFCVGAAVLLGGGAAAIIIVKKKQKKR